MDETLAGPGAAPLIAALDSASPDRAAARASAHASIDWDEVRGKLAHRTAELEATFAGRGPWADAVLARRAEELAATPQTDDQTDGGAGAGDRRCCVGRGIVDDDDLGIAAGPSRLAQHRIQAAPEQLLFVVGRDDDREPHAFHLTCRTAVKARSAAGDLTRLNPPSPAAH